MNDQTIIDLGQYGKHEIQAIRGFYGDGLNWKNDLDNTRIENDQLKKDLLNCQQKPPETQFTADLTQVSVSDLLIAVIKKIFK